MTSIDSTSRLAAVIRGQVSSLRQTNRTARSPAERTKTSTRAAAGGQDIATVVAQRIQGIDPDDPNRARKSFRVFLEAVLLAEFGNELMNDPRFYQLVEDVQAHMHADPELNLAIQEADRLMFSDAARK